MGYKWPLWALLVIFNKFVPMFKKITFQYLLSYLYSFLGPPKTFKSQNTNANRSYQDWSFAKSSGWHWKKCCHTQQCSTNLWTKSKFTISYLVEITVLVRGAQNQVFFHLLSLNRLRFWSQITCRCHIRVAVKDFDTFRSSIFACFLHMIKKFIR